MADNVTNHNYNNQSACSTQQEGTKRKQQQKAVKT